MIMASRLTISNRPESQALLTEFIQKWAKERGLAAARRAGLERTAREIFQHLVTHAYASGQPGAITLMMEDSGARLRLMFEDDAPPHNPTVFNGPQNSGPNHQASGNSRPKQAPPLVESLIYYRTPDRKNRLVVFLNL